MPSNAPPWLAGVIATAGDLEAHALRDAIAARGARVRAIPSGGGRIAWNAVLPDGRTVAVVLTGPGPEGAAAAARTWTLQARSVVTLASGPATAAGRAALLYEGDPVLAARVRSVATAAAAGRLASTPMPPRSPEAAASLAATGVDAVDGGSDTWREAAARVGVPAVALHVVTDAAPPPPARAWRTATARALRMALHPRSRDPLTAAERAHVGVLAAGARAAVAACVGAPTG